MKGTGMSEEELEKRIAEIRAKREAMGLADPLNLLRHYVSGAGNPGFPVITEKKE